MTDRNGTQTHITYNMYHSITGRRAVSSHQLKAGGSDRRYKGDVGGPDDGGHLIATIFGGSGRIDNMVAMNYNLNRGVYKSLESTWAAILTENPKAKVNVNISAVYSGDSMRPTTFKVSYSVDGIDMGTEVFANEYGGGK